MFRRILILFICFVSTTLFSANGDHKKLLKKCEERLKENPDSYPASLNKGYALYKMGKYPEAIQDFKAAYANAMTDPQKAMARYNIGNAFFLQKKLQEALKEYRLGLIFTPEDEDLKYNYTITKMLLESKKKNKNKKKKQGDKNSKNKKKQKDKNKQKDKKSGKKNQKQGKNKQKDKQKQQQQKRKGAMSKADAKRLLKALNDKEKKSMNRKQVFIRGPKKEKSW